MQNILLQSPQGVKYCVNCEEIEKDPSVVSSESMSQHRPAQHSTEPCTITDVTFESIENVLLSKLQAAVVTLQETNSSEITIHQCQVIKACSEAVLAVRRLTSDNEQ